MTRETSELAELLRQAYEGSPSSRSGNGWHGPSARAIVADLTCEQAQPRPSARAHSIWELVLHIAVWDEICERRLHGEHITMTTGSDGDWEYPTDLAPARWSRALDRLTRAQATLVSTVRSLHDSDLDRQVAGWPWTYRLMIHGTLHHDLYHFGQIALIARAM